MQPLDNPIWTSLTTRHAGLAHGDAHVQRYAREMAPFVAIESPDAASSQDVARVVAPDESLYMVGTLPHFDTAWHIEQRAVILQMVWSGGRIDGLNASSVRVLEPDDLPAMVELTALVFPGFFRARTPEMGKYLGIFAAGRLVAMAGERMHTNTHQEISAVCTHPDFTGRGLARLLMGCLINDSLERGETPFLHVGDHNVRARALYEQMGFATRTALPMVLVRRSAA